MSRNAQEINPEQERISPAPDIELATCEIGKLLLFTVGQLDINPLESEFLGASPIRRARHYAGEYEHPGEVPAECPGWDSNPGSRRRRQARFNYCYWLY